MILFQAGDIESDEYFRQKDFHERQIAYWEAQTTERAQTALELTATMELIDRLKRYWGMSEGEDQRILAQSLFDEIVYDLDQQRIVDFKVKLWAQPFLMLRAALYHDLMGEEMKNRFNERSGLSNLEQFVDPIGHWNRTFTLGRRCRKPTPRTPLSRFSTTSRTRN